MEILIALLVAALFFALGMAFQLHSDTKDINLVLEENKKLNDTIKQMKEDPHIREEVIQVVEIHDDRVIYKAH